MQCIGLPIAVILRRAVSSITAGLLVLVSAGLYASTPYTGTAMSLPSTFQAEDFDKGGEGSGYHDISSSNEGGQYRPNEGVDIAASTNLSSFVVNNFRTGEWLAYTVNVTTAGKFDLGIQASNNGNLPSAFHIEIDGVDVTGRISVPPTGGWDTYRWFGTSGTAGVSLSRGQHVLKLVSDAEHFNVNAIGVTFKGTGGVAFSGTPVSLPGIIEAENFDKGGQGLGYHDLSAGNSGGLYRTSESVDIIASRDNLGGGYVVTSIHTGEWLAYTVNVATAGKYNIAVRVSNNSVGAAAFHIESDGIDITGKMSVPITANWESFTWVSIGNVSLSAGQHQLKLVSDAQYFNLNSISVQPAGTTSSGTSTGSAGTPFSGTPINLPVVFEAENFDRGGEGMGYHEITAGNAGGLYRGSESVDIYASTDAQGGGYVVGNFHTGEWLAYTVNVPVAGNYDLYIRASNNQSPAVFHFEVDGRDVTGPLQFPNTGGWNSFVWAGKRSVALSAGRHVLKLVADLQYMNVNSISAALTGTGTPSLTGATSSTTSVAGTAIKTRGNWLCDFEGNSYCGFEEHSKLESSGGRRSSFASISRNGTSGIRLQTLSGDNYIHGSGHWERNDLSMPPSSGYCNQGQEEWWGHSILFPSDYVFPPGPDSGIVFDFHHNYSAGQSNFEIGTIPGVGLRIRGHGGSSLNGGQYSAVVADPYGARANITKNQWYDFNYHVLWSAGSDGYMIVWLNGRKVMSYSGPTLYNGISCYMKLANYHAPFGQASAVIHDRVVMGTSASSVSLWTLE